MNIPIYRAKKIDSDEYVIGYYQTETGTNVEDKNNMFPTLRHIIVDLDKHQLRLDLFGDGKLHDDSHIREQYEIDPTTLAISFDNGKSFIKLGDLEIHTCTDFDLKYTDMKMRNRQEKQPPNGNIFTIITDKGR